MTHFIERRRFLEHANTPNQKSRGVLMMLDADNFSTINDTWGAVAAELAVQAIEEAVEASVRDDDSISYMEDGKFMVFVQNVTTGQGQKVVERIRKAVAETTFEPKQGLRHTLTVSIGAVVVAPKQDARRLVGLAETCLGHAKRNGQNSVVMKTYFRASEEALAA